MLLKGPLKALCRDLLVSKALRHIFSTLRSMLRGVNAGQLKKATVGYIDSAEKPKLLDLSELLTLPLKQGKANKVSGSKYFMESKVTVMLYLKQLLKRCRFKGQHLSQARKVYFFSEWQEIHILCIYYYVYFCQCWEIDKSIFLQGTSYVFIQQLLSPSAPAMTQVMEDTQKSE